IVQENNRYAENYVRRLLRPRPGRTVTIQLEHGLPVKVLIAKKELELSLEYTPNGRLRLHIYHTTLTGVVVPLALEYSYCPSMPFTPIYGSKQHDDEAAQNFSIEVWSANFKQNGEYKDIADPNVQLVNEIVITESHSRLLCKSIGNNSWHYAFPREGALLAPIEFINIAYVKDLLHLLQSSLFGAGQLNVVHLYNDYTHDEGAPMLRVNDKLTATTRVDGLVNTKSGKKISLETTLHCEDTKIGVLKSAFLSRSYYADVEQTFEHSRKQKFTILLPSEVDIAALKNCKWFIYHESAANELKPNIPVDICLDSEYRFKKDMYSSIATTGKAVIWGLGGNCTCIADIEFSCDTSTENPVLEYLSQFKTASDKIFFTNGGYSLVTRANANKVQKQAPKSNWRYAKQSFDGNPFHLNPYVADFAGLPGTITHGLWTNASTRAIVETIAADGQPERIRSYRTEFIDMVFPKDKLTTELYHIGMRNGRMLIKGQTTKVDSGPVMDITAEIDQPRTAYVFTGQGSQEKGMGMELYEQSSAARAVWDRANQHMLKTYDIDLLDIVRNNPKETTVYFTGRAGEIIRRNYMALTKQVSDEDKLSLVPIIPEITLQSVSYTFRSSNGLLNATQFTQTALIILATAIIADMRANGLVKTDSIVAGHSLGEYCALAALGDIFTIEGLLDITFYRGLIMQSAVPRDEQGRSGFGMVAVDPSRVGKGFTEEMLFEIVDNICAASPGLLQLVNFNVRGQQYVAAGTLTNLAVLRLVLDDLAAAAAAAAAAEVPPSEIAANASQVIERVVAEPFSTAPVRGKATIPLPGIDVPFHSKQLLNGVSEFRAALLTKINGATVNPELLYHRYIPNVTAVPFAVTREYFEMVLTETGSPIISDILANWNSDDLNNPAEKKRLAVALLIELLAYQLASPVQWIKTQDHLFGAAEVQRVIEIGPSPILCGMAAKTLRSPELANQHVSLLHCEKNRDDVYYAYEEEPAAAEAADEAASNAKSAEDTPKLATSTAANTSEPVEQHPPVQQPVQQPAPAASAGKAAGAPIVDAPLSAVDIVQAIVAFKLKQPLNRISTEQTIKSLVAGKSTLQNEIIGDLQKELGALPDKPEEVSLAELGSSVGKVSALGKCIQSLLARMVSSKMPGGFNLSTIRSQLSASYGLGPQRQDALLALALTMEPAARISDHAEATAWLDKVAQAYAAHAGISYAAATAAAVDGAAAGPVVSSVELEKMRQQETEHIQRQIEVLARYAGIDLRADGRTADKTQDSLQQLQADIDSITAEVGDDFLSGVQPRFDARKMRRFDSFWNWARQDAYEWIQQIVAAGLSGLPADEQPGIDNEERIQQLQNCADVELVQMLAGTIKVLSASDNRMLEPAIALIRAMHDACKDALDAPPLYHEFSQPMQPKTHVAVSGEIVYSELPRPSERTWSEYINHMKCGDLYGTPPLMHLREQTESGHWSYSETYSSVYFSGLDSIAVQGISFAGKTALVTGCGQGSIGAEIVCRLLAGGAKVVATTSSYSRKTLLKFEDMYRKHGSRGSELVVVPFNQGSVQDIDSLVSFITSSSSLGWNLDFVFPFAAISDIGSTATNLGSRSELAQRVMLTNVLRLLGSIKTAKERTQRTTRPSLVVLPL
ncbi:fatty acid synthase alpha subunit Lsd1, partial [Coemansia brasiliensis]